MSQPELVRKCFNLSQISNTLADVTTAATPQEVAPDTVGLTQEAVDRIWHRVERLYATGTQPAIQLCLRRQGQIVLNRAIGHVKGNGPNDSHRSHKVLATPETPFCLFSSSKAVTALLMHMLAEEGGINLLDPVSHYLPEFAQNGKRTITIHQILSHRGGIPGIPSDIPLETLWDEQAIWRLLCEARPITVDGGKLAYHAITGGYVLGKVVEKVSGRSIQSYLQEKIRDPMGMTHFTYGLDEASPHALATNYVTGPIPRFPLSWVVKRALGADIKTVERVANDPKFQRVVIPAGNLVGTAEEMSRFFQMMLNDGKWKRRRICQPMTVQRATQEFGALQFDRTLMVPMRYSAGMMLGGEPFGFWGPHSKRAFGHLGLINKLCWADPDRDISVALLTSGIPILAHHIPELVRFVMTVCQETGPR